MAKLFKLATSEKVITGYKGKRLTNDNLSTFPDRLLNIWHIAGIIKPIKNTQRNDTRRDKSSQGSGSSKKG